MTFFCALSSIFSGLILQKPTFNAVLEIARRDTLVHKANTKISKLRRFQGVAAQTLEHNTEHAQSMAQTTQYIVSESHFPNLPTEFGVALPYSHSILVDPAVFAYQNTRASRCHLPEADTVPSAVQIHKSYRTAQEQHTTHC